MPPAKRLATQSDQTGDAGEHFRSLLRSHFREVAATKTVGRAPSPAASPPVRHSRTRGFGEVQGDRPTVANSASVVLSDQQVEALYQHWLLYERWNRVLNLSAIHDLETAVVKHYCESLFLGSCLPGRPARVVDVGSGAGFPGFPVAVLRPDCGIVLVESHQRKAVFLKEATRSTPNVRIFAGRAEDLDEHFDWMVSRAVAWKGLERDGVRLADRVGLLVSPADCKELMKDSLFRWREPVPLPWGERGVVLMGDVPRET